MQLFSLACLFIVFSPENIVEIHLAFNRAGEEEICPEYTLTWRIKWNQKSQNLPETPEQTD